MKRALGQGHFVKREPADYSLVVEQRDGITMDPVQELAQVLLHQHD